MFKNNKVVEYKRLQKLSNHFALTKPSEERATIQFASMAIIVLQALMFASLAALPMAFPVEGFRLIILLCSSATIAYLIVTYKHTFTENMLIAEFNLNNPKLSEETHEKAVIQYDENKSKVTSLWVLALTILLVGGFFAGRNIAALSVEKAEISSELQQNYAAAANTYKAANDEGKSAKVLKSLLSEMKQAETKLAANKKFVSASNEAAAADSNVYCAVCGIMFAFIDGLIGLALFKLMQFKEKLQYAEFIEANGGAATFQGEADAPKSQNTEGVKSVATKEIDKDDIIRRQSVIIEGQKNELKKLVSLTTNELTSVKKELQDIQNRENLKFTALNNEVLQKDIEKTLNGAGKS